MNDLGHLICGWYSLETNRTGILALSLFCLAGRGEDAPTAAPSTVGAARTVAAAQTRTAPQASMNRLPPWDAQPCGLEQPRLQPMVGYEALRDRSPADLRTAYGEPSSTERYRLGDMGGLFYSSTGNILPGGPAANADRQVWQIIWTKEGCDLTVRFVDRDRGWVAVEAFEAVVGTDY